MLTTSTVREGASLLAGAKTAACNADTPYAKRSVRDPPRPLCNTVRLHPCPGTRQAASRNALHTGKAVQPKCNAASN